jgi:HK97 family phage portal protein
MIRLFAQRDDLPNVTGEYPGGSVIRPLNSFLSLVGGAVTTAGVQVTEWVAEGMPAAYACIHAISETVGQVPLKLYRKTAAGREIADEHPLYTILHDLPNAEMTAYQFREIMTRHLAMWGRSYAYIDRAPDGEVTALWPLHPTRMYVDRDELNRKRYRYWQGKNQYAVWIHDPNRPPILHLHMNSSDGLDGRSPILINRESLGITKATEDYVAAWFGNGAIPGLMLSHPGKLSEKAKENLRRSWFEKFGGAKKANKVAILEEDIKAQVVGVDPQKSQLRELREDQIASAARIWRVPSFIIQNHTKDTSWGSGIEHQMLGWVKTGLEPYFTQWQQAITRDLLSRKTYKTHYAKFQVNALTSGDTKTRFESYAIARQNTILSGNECRELEEFNRVEEGDVFLTPSGAQPVIGDGTPVDVVQVPTPEPTRNRLTLADEPKKVM